MKTMLAGAAPAQTSGVTGRRQRRERGSIIVMFTTMMAFVMIPLVGLGIDATMLYSVRAKLQSAVDGAALAAAESLSAGLTLAAQESAGALTADEFIRANIVTGAAAGGGGYWGSYSLNDSVCTGSTATTAGTPSGTPTQITYASSGNCIVFYQDNTNKQRTVSLAASVQVPLIFMRILGFSSGTVTARGTAARRDVVMVLVIDRSGSMGAELTAVQAGATYFVNQFSSGRDKLGLVLISGSAMVAYPPADWGIFPPTGATGPDINFKGSTETPNMLTTIGAITSGSNTGTAEGLMLAYKELQAANETGALNIIVLWTDGDPNGLTADFNYGTSGTNSLITGNGCTNQYDGTNGLYPNFSNKSILGWMAQDGGYDDTSTVVTGVRQRTQTATTGMTISTWATLSSPGTTGGVESLLSTSAGAAAAGCAWGTATPGNSIANVVSIPATDYYGNSTQGSSSSPYTQTDYHQSLVWSTTSSNCRQGGGGTGGSPLKLSGTLSGGTKAAGNACQVGLASWNAADMAAKQIHADTTLTPIIYTMGYAGSVSGNGGVDVALLERMANCNPGKPCAPGGANATNTVYNSAIPSGMYIQVQTTTDVTPAFQTLLSEILRLSY